MSTPESLTELLASLRTVDRKVTYLEGEGSERAVGFGELYERALGILHHLQKLGAQRGDKLIIFLASNEQFIDAFWAAILGGIVPVPVAIGISDEHKHKLLRIAHQLGSPYLYTDRKTLERIAHFAAQSAAEEAQVLPALRARTFLMDDLHDISRAGKAVRAVRGDVAFIQFSSGSTSAPKGVVLTHGNLIANWLGARQAGGFSPDDVTLSWMPLTHDMGLIGMHIFMIASHCHVLQMPTELFVRRPLLWLQFATRKKATILCSPNFGYRHYLKVLGDRPVDELDLAAVRLIFNGAEPISVQLAEEFLARLRPARLRRNAMFPVYGLAEASVAVSFPEPGSALRSLVLDRHRMGVGESAHKVARGERDALELVSVGRAIPHCEMRIAADNDRPVPDGHFGHIQIRGANVTRGYYENPAANAALMTADGWVRTGDLGLIDAGDLYITGRAKEIIFINGQNYYPHDLEGLALRAPGMELGKVVVGGVRRADSGTDELLVFVLHRTDLREFVASANAIARLINEHAGLEVAEVVPVKRIPKTTSGKIQRHVLEEEYLGGAFDAELRELAALREALRGPAGATRSEIENRIKSICDAALAGRNVGVDDNLFELGASSLKLIEIHEQIDQQYPNQIDLTELFDFPTIAELARHLEAKLAALRPHTAIS